MTEREVVDGRDSMSLAERVRARLEIDNGGADYGSLAAEQLERLAEVLTVDDEFSSGLHRIMDEERVMVDVDVNVELLEQVMDHIVMWPLLLDSAQWRCGTSRCFAGWTAELTGATWLFDVSDKRVVELAGRSDLAYAFVRTPAGDVRHVEDYAAEVLRISEHAAGQLFAGDTSVTELSEMVNNLCDFGTVYDAAPRTRSEVTSP